jgi:hypothetical protein
MNLVHRLAVLSSSVVLAAGLLVVASPSAHATPGGTNGLIAFTSNRDGNNEIYSMQAAGTNLRRLTNNPASDGHAAWSPDGRRIAFDRATSTGPSSVMVMAADGSAQTFLADGSDPTWSPDGSRIAFERSADIWVMNADGSNQQALVHSGADELEPAWSPVGDQIVFMTTADGPAHQLHSVDVSTGVEKALTHTADRGVHNHWPSWSPDGSKIALYGTPDADFTSGPTYEVRTMNADGTGMAVTSAASFDMSPAWSPDGTTIAYMHHGDGGWDLMALAADGQSASTLLPGPADDKDPDWQRVPVRGSAYLWADQPVRTTTYAPMRNYQHNSAHGVNTVTRTATGAYTVRLAGLGVDGGVVHATAYGADKTWCKVATLSVSAGDQTAYVRCFSADSVPADSQFTLSYTNLRSSSAPIAYLESTRPFDATSAPDPAFSFNSQGGSNTITRTGVGAYTATLGAMARPASSNVLVTAYGGLSGRCQAAGWNDVGADVQVRVQCTLPSGSPTDAGFSLTFSRASSYLDRAVSPTVQAGYVWANQPSTATYTPDTGYQYNSHGLSNTASRSGTGSYAVRFPSLDLNKGTVQVTAYGSAGQNCKATSWGTDTVWVRCFNAAGSLADAQFDLAVTAVSS